MHLECFPLFFLRICVFVYAWLALTLSLALSAVADDSVDPSGGANAKEELPAGSMEANGRILDYPRPSGLNNPKRWRYYPPERIVNGNFLQRFLVSSFITPIVFRDSDVGTGGGIALTDIDFREKKRQEFAGIFLTYSSEGQQNYSFVWRRWQDHIILPNGGVLLEERSHLTVRGGFQRSLTRRFFGFGDDTSEEDESSYTDETFFLGASYRRSFPEPGDDFIFDGGFHLESHRLSDGEVSGVPSTADAFRAEFEDAESSQIAWSRFGMSYDTRDSQVNPYDGFAVGLAARNAIRDGAEYLGIFGTHGTYVLPVPALFYTPPEVPEENPPTDSVALYGEVLTSAGELPFYVAPSLGGADRHRGYIAGRFAGDSRWFSGIEHRFWVLPRGFGINKRLRIERVGLATFYEIGAVSDSFSDLSDASVAQSYGFGLRFTLERSAPFRVDVGFSEEDVEVNARFGLSF